MIDPASDYVFDSVGIVGVGTRATTSIRHARTATSNIGTPARRRSWRNSTIAWNSCTDHERGTAGRSEWKRN